jgi:hypothetical protein
MVGDGVGRRDLDDDLKTVSKKRHVIASVPCSGLDIDFSSADVTNLLASFHPPVDMQRLARAALYVVLLVGVSAMPGDEVTPPSPSPSFFYYLLSHPTSTSQVPKAGAGAPGLCHAGDALAPLVEALRPFVHDHNSAYHRGIPLRSLFVCSFLFWCATHCWLLAFLVDVR